jgi:leader peptidase (prepilin peptidase)/N-methyltransferase
VTPSTYVAVAAVLGACVGSFLNVVVWRLPRGESLVHPRSRCPGCGAGIRWFDNVPVLSWIALRGRCRRCRAAISPRYPLVEALTAALFVLTALRHGPDEVALAAAKALALSALLALAAIDWDHKILPDAITKPGIVAGLVLSLLVPALHGAPLLERAKPGASALAESAFGAALGWFLIVAIRWIASRLLKKEAMGLGDAKLLAMIGAFAGPAAVLYTLLLASVSGAAIGAAWLAVRARRPASVEGTVTPGPEGAGAIAFRRARVSAERIAVETSAPLPPGTRVRVQVRLTADDLLDDVGATVDVPGVVEEARGGFLSVRLDDADAPEAEPLAAFALVRKYVPFGPFLALGGAAMLLYREDVVRFFTETWPAILRGGA